MPNTPKGFSLSTLGLCSLLSAGLTYGILRIIPARSTPSQELTDSHLSSSPSTPMPPWGNLVRVPMVTQKPGEFIDEASLSAAPVEWHFKNLTIDQTVSLLRSCQIPDEQFSVLLEASNRGVDPDGIRLRVPDSVVLGLTPDQRRQLYLQIRTDPRNSFIHYPFTFRKGRATELLSSSLRPETLSLVSRLIYQIGNSDCFSDLGPLLRQIPDSLERLHLIQALTRQETILLKVRITPETDLESILSWWGKYSRRKDLRCLLDSLTSVPGGTTIDTVHLMPGFPRRRIYTYPAAPPPGYHGYDCHYSSLNFLRTDPNDAFLNPDVAAKTLADDYTRVEGDRQFGDIILFTRDGNSIVHSCVFIAEDIVFTKNGANEMQPWVLMTLDQVESAYPSEDPWQKLTYRLKTPAS